MEIELDPPYKGWVAECDADPPWGLWASLDSGDTERLAAAIVGTYKGTEHRHGFVLSWNFADRDGNALEPVPEDLDQVPTGAIRGLLQGYGAAFRALPNGPAASSSRTSSTRGGQNRKAPRRR
jgi:hypothetical protein